HSNSCCAAFQAARSATAATLAEPSSPAVSSNTSNSTCSTLSPGYLRSSSFMAFHLAFPTVSASPSVCVGSCPPDGSLGPSDVSASPATSASSHAHGHALPGALATAFVSSSFAAGEAASSGSPQPRRHPTP